MDAKLVMAEDSDMATHTQKIRELAVRAGLSLARIEQGAGLPQGRLSKAKGGMLRRDELERVAGVLGVAVSAFSHAQADPDRYMLDHLIEQYGPRQCVFWILDGSRREGAGVSTQDDDPQVIVAKPISREQSQRLPREIPPGGVVGKPQAGKPDPRPNKKAR